MKLKTCKYGGTQCWVGIDSTLGRRHNVKSSVDSMLIDLCVSGRSNDSINHYKEFRNSENGYYILSDIS